MEGTRHRVEGPVVPTFDLSSRVEEIRSRWGVVGLAVGTVRDGELESFHGAGLADIDAHTGVTEDTIFRIASITKTFTGVAIMQLWEQGLVDLDAPANEYLRAFRLLPADPSWRPATVRHLLTHSAGVPEIVRVSRILHSGWFSESYSLDEPLPSLGEYYGGALRLAAEPGNVFAYTDHGFATLGQIVEDVSGQPFDDYLREHVLDPLGMDDSAMTDVDGLAPRRATGYRITSRGPKALVDRRWITCSATELRCSARDLARYVGALLQGGQGEHGTILKPRTVEQMFAPQYQPDPRIPGMGLAFWRVDLGGRRAVEHQGVLPGFNSQVFLAPDDGVGVLALTNGAAGALRWLAPWTSVLLGDVIGAPPDAVRQGLSQHPEVWGELCGRYRVRAQRTDMQARSMVGAGLIVAVRRGQLVVRALSPLPTLLRGFVLHPDDEDDPYVFRIDLTHLDLGTARIVFVPDGAIVHAHLEMPPLSLVRHRAQEVAA
jgi:CubicO group peptidase (beta-lactamase class C family)